MIRILAEGGDITLPTAAYGMSGKVAPSDSWRTTWPVVSGMPNRAAACRLVGNSIVPWIAAAIFAAIQRVDA